MSSSWRTRSIRSRQSITRYISACASQVRTAVRTAVAKESFGTPLCDLPVDSLHAKIYNKKILKKIERLGRGCVFYQYFLFRCQVPFRWEGKEKTPKAGAAWGLLLGRAVKSCTTVISRWRAISISWVRSFPVGCVLWEHDADHLVCR